VGELTFLRRWKEEILTKIGNTKSGTAEVMPTPKLVDRAAELQAQIELAIIEERYEDAAMLRDELKRLRTGQSPDAAV
jgi:protein-arginine kinase activator protein McsA